MAQSNDTYRPHYHAILFGLDLPDINKTSHCNEIGQPLYESEFLSNVWKKGAVEIGECSPASCSYVARYCLKKANGIDRRYFEDLGLPPEFVRMSRRPGIASQYFREHPEKFDLVSFKVSNGKQSVDVRPSRYFRKLQLKSDPESYDTAKRLRQISAFHSTKGILDQTDVEFLTYLNNSENLKNQQIQSLQRNKI